MALLGFPWWLCKLYVVVCLKMDCSSFCRTPLLESLQNLFGGCDRNLLFRKVLWTEQIGLKMALKGWNSVFEPENMHFLIKRGGLGAPPCRNFSAENQLTEKRSPISFTISGRRKGMFISLTLSHRNWSECHGHQTLKWRAKGLNRDTARVSSHLFPARTVLPI